MITIWMGPPASGKSYAKRVGDTRLTADGFTVISLNDRDALTDQVAKEMREKGFTLTEQGQIESDNTILLNPSAPPEAWGMIFKNPRSLNIGHETLFKRLAELDKALGPNEVISVELAIGRNEKYGEESLRQNASDFMEQLREHGIHDDVVVIDIQASLAVRVPRNAKREGHIPDPEFMKYFPDEGGFTQEEIHALNGRYRGIQNEHLSMPGFRLEAHRAYDEVIRPRLRLEGQRPGVEVPRFVFRRKEG